MISEAIEMNNKEMFIQSVDSLIDVCANFPDMKDACKSLAEIFRQFNMLDEAKSLLLSINGSNDPNINKIINQINKSKNNINKSK